MRLKITLLFAFVMLAITNTYAGFPVTRTITSTETGVTLATADTGTAALTSPAAGIAGKDMWVAVAFWFFLGAFAAHRWYLGSPIGWNILFIITLGGLGIWAIVDLINILTRNWDGL